jgi:acetylornithine deacetylase
MDFKSRAVQVEEASLHQLLARLVGTRSVNPLFDPSSPGEAGIAAVVMAEAGRLGMSVTRFEAEPGRVSVVARWPGADGGRSLLLYAHHDTVGVTGMTGDPFAAEIREGRMYGRGSYDMKCGLAACFAAVRALQAAEIALAGDLLIASVADEEAASIGIADVLAGVHADAAIVTEPTELALCVAHKGFAWLEIETIGRAAHGSRYEEGVDANMRMGRVLARLESLERQLRLSPPHPLLGPPSMHAGLIAGGTGQSIYSARCTLQVEWRMLPHETEAGVLATIEAILAELRAEDASFEATARVTLVRPPFEIGREASIVTTVREAATAVLGAEPPTTGAPFWMDAALIAEAGIPVVVFGPVGEGAHADVEWVDLASVRQVAEVLARSAMTFCGVTSATQ